jgi:hypothetical protein
LFSVPSTENEKFVPIPCAFSKIAMLNPISILVVSLPISTIDSSPLEAFEYWNLWGFSLLMLTKMGMGPNLSTITKSAILLGKQY